MQKPIESHLWHIAFYMGMEQEKVQLQKYKWYKEKIKDTHLKKMIKEFEKICRDHIQLIENMMMKLNIKN